MQRILPLRQQIFLLKKAGYIFLLLLIALQSGGLWFVCEMQKCIVEFKMEQAIRSKDSGFVTLTIPLAEFDQKNTREISYNGKMYDIKSFTISGDVATLQVLNDTEEERIDSKLRALGRTTDSDPDDLFRHLLDLLTQQYICPTPENFVVSHDVQEMRYMPFHPDLISHQLDIISPPPKA